MTTLNKILTVLLVIGLFLPGIATASGLISSTGFAGIFFKFLAGIAFLTLVTNIVALRAYKNSRK